MSPFIRTCHLLLNFKTPRKVSISGTTITSTITLLGIITDAKLNFENHSIAI